MTLKEALRREFVDDFNKWLEEKGESVKVRPGTEGLLHKPTRTIVIPANVDEYTKRFILLHELGHLWLHDRYSRQNEYVPDLIAATNMHELGYEPELIMEAHRLLADTPDNRIRTLLVWMALKTLEEDDAN